ncbi:MAG: ATPase [Proteobacteria bacterium]|nr:ATPase [Pseudomonadota bacterium]
MSQIALPLRAGNGVPERIVVGNANAPVLEAMATCRAWPFRTAVLRGPPRSGKSLIARWFAGQGLGEAIDDADRMDEVDLFHRWNRTQESGTPLLVVSGAGQEQGQWQIALPDLRSRLGAALHLTITTPDDAMMSELLLLHAEQRRLALGPDAAAYLAARAERSHIGAERLVAAIDRISLERKAAPTMAVWREALEEIVGSQEPRLL